MFVNLLVAILLYGVVSFDPEVSGAMHAVHATSLDYHCQTSL